MKITLELTDKIGEHSQTAKSTVEMEQVNEVVLRGQAELLREMLGPHDEALVIPTEGNATTLPKSDWIGEWPGYEKGDTCWDCGQPLPILTINVTKVNPCPETERRRALYNRGFCSDRCERKWRSRPDEERMTDLLTKASEDSHKAVGQLLQALSEVKPKGEEDRLFRSQVTEVLDESLLRPPGETWKATDEGVVQYLRDILSAFNHHAVNK